MSELERRLANLAEEFLFLDPGLRVEHLLNLAQEVTPMPEPLRNEGCFVEGCASPLWLRVEHDGHRLHVMGASTGVVPQALVALVVRLFDGLPSEALEQAELDLASRLGLAGQLTPTREAALERLVARVRQKARPVWKDDPQTRFGGLNRLLGAQALPRLTNAHVAVVGVGGVGTWVVEALVRSGVGQLTLIDPDTVAPSNTNRQLHALNGAWGQAKVTLMAERATQISPQTRVVTRKEFLSVSNVEQLLADRPHAVVDAVDTVEAKAALAWWSRQTHVPLWISGGAGGRLDPTAVRLVDLGQEQGDGLLKALKRQLKADGWAPDHNNRFGLATATSLEPARSSQEACLSSPQASNGRLGCDLGYGSASFVTGAFGLTLASAVVRHLTQGPDWTIQNP